MKKQERRQKYDQIREMYEPVVRAKNYAMRQMIETGNPVITLFGLGAIVLLGRQKKKYILFFGAVTTVLDLIAAIIGFCTLDWILLIVEVLLILPHCNAVYANE